MIELLAKEITVNADDRILLSHKTTTINSTDSPASLALTTADIIGDFYDYYASLFNIGGHFF